MNTELNSIKGKKVLVIGDVMLDTYHIGNVKGFLPKHPYQWSVSPVPTMYWEERPMLQEICWDWVARRMSSACLATTTTETQCRRCSLIWVSETNCFIQNTQPSPKPA